ncbi:MAG: ABC transporter ATP-binding protein [Deltaproteobacteria bacterium]|nr:ABC transporter ATP-binding protein [Deltaproteobacteria bacterium]
MSEAPPEPAARPHVVEFSHVTKTYGAGRSAFTAIEDISFTVEDLPGKGEFICLLGPSGCGKSTVLRLIAGLEPQHPPTSGTVTVLGKRVAGPSSDRGMVFQDYTSFDHLTVLDNVVFGLACSGVPRRQRTELGREWIARVGLDVKKDQNKYPHELSGGMRQRVAIARTLILHPRIILMDEPFGALDPQTRANMQELLVRLWRDVEATVFFVTHSVAEGVYLGDRIYVFDRSPGRLRKELQIEPATLPPWEAERQPRFQEQVGELQELMRVLEGGDDARQEAGGG